MPNTAEETVSKPRPKSEQKSQQPVYNIKIVLLETKPQIWRQFIVPSSVTLHHLHLILQAIMGWTNSHLYKFQIGQNKYAEPDPDNDLYELDFKNSRLTKLRHVVTRKGEAFQYEYDFGDAWTHMLLIEDIFEREPGKQYPVCLSGERVCPPEDCGGTHGYAELLEIIKNPYHEQYLDMMTWLGGHFDPDSFDIELVNRKLRSMHV